MRTIGDTCRGREPAREIGDGLQIERAMFHVDHAVIEPGQLDDPGHASRGKLLEPGAECGASLTHGSADAVLFHISPPAGISQATGSSRPASDDCLIVSRKRCRSTAVSKVGNRLCVCPVWTASANR